MSARRILIRLAIIALVMVLTPYALGPVLVYRKQRFRIPTEIIPIDPLDQPLPDSVSGHFRDSHEVLTRLGFEQVGIVGLPNLVTGAQSICAFYVNRQTCALANATFIVATPQSAAAASPLVVRYVEFVTRHKDGVVVQTTNSQMIGAFPAPPFVHTAQFFGLQDVARLYDLHEFHQSRHNFSPPINRLDLEFQGDLLKYVATAVLEEVFSGQLETGYLARTPEGYRPTVKAAFIMTWQELWPFSAIRKHRRRRAAQQILTEFETVTPAATPVASS